LHFEFPCGTNEFVPGFISDFSGQWALSLALSLFPLSYVLLSIIDIYFHLLSCLSLRFFKDKQGPSSTSVKTIFKYIGSTSIVRG
jgi:hypothetical protein